MCFTPHTTILIHMIMDIRMMALIAILTTATMTTITIIHTITMTIIQVILTITTMTIPTIIITMEMAVTRTCRPNRSPGVICWRSAFQVG